MRKWALLLVFASASLQPGLRDPSEPPRRLVVSAAAPDRGLHPGREPGFAAGYDFAPVRNQIRSHRLQLAACLMRNPDSSARRIRMTLQWEAQGSLKSVSLSPDAGPAVRECMVGLARLWPFEPHPALQPFSYSVVLAPSGL